VSDTGHGMEAEAPIGPPHLRGTVTRIAGALPTPVDRPCANLAAGIALPSAMLHLALAMLLFAISRAQGWRRARVFALIALTAGLYSSAKVWAGGITRVSCGYPTRTAA
jgi:hypothetical protein